MLRTKILTGLLALSLPVALLACGDDDDDDDVAGIPAPGDDTPTQPAQQQETPTPSPSPDDQDEVTFDLEEQDDSGFSGEVRMEAVGNQTRVTVEADDEGDDAGTPRPAHIHRGTCDDLDPVPAYPLEDVMDGESETLVDVELSELLDGEYAVNVHRSAQEAEIYIACGEIED